MNPSRWLLKAARNALAARQEFNASRAALRGEGFSSEHDEARERARAAQRAFHNANNILASHVCQELGVGLPGMAVRVPPLLPPHLAGASSAESIDDDVDELTMPADDIAALIEHFDAREQAGDESAAASE